MKYKEKEIETIPEFVPDEYFSVISLKRAVWQYLLDHARISDEDKTFKFNFYLPSEQEFWRRVRAREDGLFSRNDIADFEEKAERKYRAIQKIRQENNRYRKIEEQNKWWSNRLIEKLREGTIVERLLMRLARFMNKTSRKINNKICNFKR